MRQVIKALQILPLLLISWLSFSQNAEGIKKADRIKLYWFIPDGVRAEPDLFNIYEWAKEGKLPNIAKMMEQGSYGYSLPVFPSHTPVNFATLLTGSYPKTHGIADGPMHAEGHPLSTVSVPGFRSLSRRVPAVWSIMENEGRKVMVISTPGSTPPEIEDGYILRGRWGGWGADVQAINFEKKMSGEKMVKPGNTNKLFNFGAELTKYISSRPASGWSNIPKSYSTGLEAELSAWGNTIFCYIFDDSDDNKTNYNSIVFSTDKKTRLTVLKQGAWSPWLKVNLKIGSMQFETTCKIRLIIQSDIGFFRIRIYYNNLNEHICIPGEMANDINQNVGPMMAFVDNFPPQLIYFREDKDVFLEEMNMSFDWHTRLVPYIEKKYHPDVVIHDCYNPNQMLTSRWWMGSVDPMSDRYNEVTENERKVLWDEVQDMYKRLDSIIGEVLNNCDDNTLVVFSSDHGICVSNKAVKLNNLLAQKGYLKFTVNDSTGVPSVDWKNTRAIFLQMIGIYINPNGLDGDWKRASGPEYEKLRDEVASLLLNLTDSKGVHPVTSVTKWEDAEKTLKLPKDRIGDLIITNAPGYGWTESMSKDLNYFETPLFSGYKQGLPPESTSSLWTPFIIMGPGVAKGHKLEKNICNVDQLPTILTLMGIDIPAYMDGQPINEIMEKY